MNCKCDPDDCNCPPPLTCIPNDAYDRLRAIEAAARKFLLAAEDWDACISPQDDEGHSLRKYIEAREKLRAALLGEGK